MAAIPDGFIAVVARFSIAGVFWMSGRTKVEGLAVSDSAIALFQDEYKLPLIAPWLAAYLAAVAEHVFPVLLVLGLATRLSALALLVMTLVIQVFVYPDAWPTHGTWAACLLFIMAHGPGPLSLDHLLAQRYGAQAHGHARQ
jgi:putative oxidoreductase